MKLFECQACNQILFFENTSCEHCGRQVGYLPAHAELTALDPASTDPESSEGDESRASFHPLAAVETRERVAYCANHAYGVCNWLTGPEEGNWSGFCFSCRFNRTIPNLNVPGNLERWRKLEVAKHRLLYTLLRLRLPMFDRREDPENGLAFDFLDDGYDGSMPVLTGHASGVITIAMREADDAAREKMRVEMGEHYRTLLGHFRHEIGHYYWNLLVRDGGWLEDCRSIFGDDSTDYQEALQAYYDRSVPPDWQNSYVTVYATAHPWEDFAETWAHYLHIVSTLETACAFGVSVEPRVPSIGRASGKALGDPYGAPFRAIMEAWMPLTYAVNSLNRSMGLPDFYPFILSDGVVRKLEFIHRLIRAHQKVGPVIGS